MRKITVSFVFGFSFNFHARLTECFNFLADFPSLWLKAGYLWKRICKRKSERNNDNGWTARGQYHPLRNYIITITPIFHLGSVLLSLLSHLNLFFTCRLVVIVIHPSIWGPVFCLPVLWKGAGQVARAGPGSVLVSPLLAKLQSQLRSHILILIVMIQQHHMSKDTTEYFESWTWSSSFHFF